MVPIPARAVVSSPAREILDFRQSPGRVGRPARESPFGPGPVPGTGSGWPSSGQLAGRFANDGQAADGQMGRRSGDEGPETVALRDTGRGTEAARWGVNLKTGHRVLPM